MKTKKIMATILAGCMCLSLSACGGDAGTAAKADGNGTTASADAAQKTDSGDKIEIRWSTVQPDTQLITQMMNKAADEINSKAEGVHVTVYSNATLGGSKEVVEGVQEGMVEMITEGPAQFASWIPETAQVEAPYLWENPEHMIKALNGDYKDKLNEQFESINVKVIGTLYYGTRQLSTNKAVKTTDDVKGMKIRVPETDLYVKMVDSWGAAPTPMGINDLYMALQTGTVDGEENPLSTFESYKFNEVNKFITLTNHIICPNMIFMNNDTWNKMSEGDQKIVQDAIDSAIAWQNEEAIAKEQNLQKQLEEKGVTFTTPDDSFKNAAIEKVKPLVSDWDYLQSLK